MKSKRKIAVISLVAMMLITAVGYATLADELEFKGTADVASFDVEYDCVLPTWDSTNNGVLSATIGYDSYGNAQDRITFTLTDALPGEEYSLDAKLHNYGDAPANIVYPTFTAPTTFSFIEFDQPSSIGAGEILDWHATIKVNDVNALHGFAGSSETFEYTFGFEQ